MNTGLPGGVDARIAKYKGNDSVIPAAPPQAQLFIRVFDLFFRLYKL